MATRVTARLPGEEQLKGTHVHAEKAGRRTEQVVGSRKEEPDFCAESFGLEVLEGEQHGRRAEREWGSKSHSCIRSQARPFRLA